MLATVPKYLSKAVLHVGGTRIAVRLQNYSGGAGGHANFNILQRHARDTSGFIELFGESIESLMGAW